MCHLCLYNYLAAVKIYRKKGGRFKRWGTYTSTSRLFYTSPRGWNFLEEEKLKKKVEKKVLPTKARVRSLGLGNIAVIIKIEKKEVCVQVAVQPPGKEHVGDCRRGFSRRLMTVYYFTFFRKSCKKKSRRFADNRIKCLWRERCGGGVKAAAEFTRH